MFKVNNKDTKTTPMAYLNIFHVSIVNFEHVIAGWVIILIGSCPKLLFQKSSFCLTGKQTSHAKHIRRYRGDVLAVQPTK